MSARAGMAASAWPGLLLSGFLAACSFALSFSALQAVGVASGIDPALGWCFPLIIDGFILQATWAAWRFRTGGLRGSWYPWLAFTVFSAISMTGNALHAHPVAVGQLRLPPAAATAFSTVPALALLIASHMLLLIATARTTHPAPTPSAEAPSPQTSTRQWTAPPTDPPKPDPADPEPADQEPASEPAQARTTTTARPAGCERPTPAAAQPAPRAPAAGTAAPVGPGPHDAGGHHLPTGGRGQGPGGAGLAVLDAAGHRPGLRVVADPVPLTVVRPLAPTTPAPRAPACDPQVMRWVATRVSAGQAITGADLVASGLASSASTARRWLRELRTTNPELFTAPDRGRP
ncbi:hypothetical protein AGMMS50218_15280 [Actinomycetota bacterium]|nr:hypothetical protein AGMMS50218_15280 [Actinomycetota bacterium]